MKTKLIFSIALLLLSFWGCSESAIPGMQEPGPEKKKNDTIRIEIAYWENAIKLPAGKGLPAISDTADWEKWNRINMTIPKEYPRYSSFTSVNPFWGPVCSSSMPFEMCMDIKKEDGWLLVDHTFNERMWPVKEYSYLIFYNTKRKVLKVTYYFDYFIAHTKGFVKLKYDGNKSIFAENNSNTITKENACSHFVTGFSLGWNGFEVELKESPYDLDGMIKMDFIFQNVYIFYNEE